MRKINIYICSAEFEVSVKDFDIYKNDSLYDEKRNDKYIFATLKTKNNEILGFFDIFLKPRQLELARKDEAFKEICEFSVFKTENDEDIKYHSFVGNFIDALEFIDKEQRRIKQETI